LYNGWITIYNIVLPITVGYILYAIGIQKWAKNYYLKLDLKT
jgi:hypothetical protein